MFQDLATRIDRASNPTIDTTPIEQALRLLGDRPVEIDTTPIENMMRDLGAKLVAPTAADMRSLEGLLREINQKLDRGATAATAPGEIEAMIRDLGARIDQRVVPAIDIHPLEEALRALNHRLDLGAAPKLDPKFVEQAADLFAERLGRRDGPSVDADALASQISEIHDRLDALQPDASSKGALDPRTVADLIAELDATRKTLQSLRELVPPDNDDIADGLADLRAEQASADKRTQARLAGLQEISGKAGRSSRTRRRGRARRGARRGERRRRAFRPSASAKRRKAADAALRGIPYRAAAAIGPGEPARSGKPDQAGQAPSLRSLDGSDFLLEPGVSLPRARALEFDRIPLVEERGQRPYRRGSPRRASRAGGKRGQGRRSPRQPAEPADSRERARGSAGGRAKAFFAARRRPILLGAALLAAIATFAAVELRGARHPVMQKSELQAPAQPNANPDIAKLAALSGAAAIDPHPIGSIAAPPTPAKERQERPRRPRGVDSGRSAAVAARGRGGRRPGRRTRTGAAPSRRPRRRQGPRRGGAMVRAGGGARSSARAVPIGDALRKGPRPRARSSARHVLVRQGGGRRQRARDA